MNAENRFITNKIETRPDDTGEKQISTRFQKGVSGNPKGRPKGARSKLGEEFVQALADDFETHGVAIIEKVRVRSPEVYLKVIKDLLPKEAVTAAFNIDVGKTKDAISEAASVEDILEAVAQEAGPEAANALASMFGIGIEAEAKGEV